MTPPAMSAALGECVFASLLKAIAARSAMQPLTANVIGA